MTKLRSIRTDLVVSKTITLPISLLEKILDEADLMQCSFSEATARLVTLAVAHRRDQRARDEDEVKKILGAKPDER
jgi:hypothetical protein